MQYKVTEFKNGAITDKWIDNEEPLIPEDRLMADIKGFIKTYDMGAGFVIMVEQIKGKGNEQMV